MLTLIPTATVLASHPLITQTWSNGTLAVTWTSQQRSPDTWFLLGSIRARAQGTNSITQARANSNGNWSAWANPNIWAQQDSGFRIFGNSSGFDARRR